MVNIYICGGIHTQNKIESLLENFCKKAKLQMEISQYETGEEICKRGRLNQIDILFLEVKANGLNGIDVASELRKVNDNAKLIYISEASGCAPDLLDYEASGYLKKPIVEDQFNNVIWRVCKRLFRCGKKFYYRADKNLHSVEKRIILYFESHGHVILIHKENNKVERFREKLSNVNEQLANGEFLPVGKSHTVNMNKIKKMGKCNVIMDDDTEVSVSRNYSKKALERYDEFMEEKTRNLQNKKSRI